MCVCVVVVVGGGGGGGGGGGVCVCVCVVVVVVVVVDDNRFYIALFSAHEQTHRVCISNREMSLAKEAAVACMLCRTVV